jgi:histidyl-tRNA synthetase
MPRIKKGKTVEAAKKAGGQSAGLGRVKGLKDVLPEEYKYWDLVGRKAQEMARLYSFKRCDLPVLEGLELYEKGLGKASDLCAKDLLSFTLKNGERLALRPDGAPSLARSFLEHNLISPETLHKSFWLGPVFVFDRYSGGRLRQFNQFSLDMFGEFGPSADAQLILIGYNFFKELQVEAEVNINSLGNVETREAYVKVINNYFKERGRKSKLCADCRKRLLKQPLAALDCREEKCQEVSADLPPIIDYLSDDCRKHFEQVLEFLDNLAIPYNLNTRLMSVRGFDFYDKTIFEFMPIGESRKHLSLGGGGNYGQLLAKLGGKNIKACGLAIDLEKTISRIRSKSVAVAADNEADVFIAQISETAKQKAMLLFEELRRAGFKVRECFISDSLKAQLEEAEKVKAKFTLILGQKELVDGTILLKDMESGVQETVDMRKIINELDKRLNIN